MALYRVIIKKHFVIGIKLFHKNGGNGGLKINEFVITYALSQHLTN